MGYLTHYTLTQERNPVDESILAKLISGDEEADYCLNDDGTTKEGGRWYEHEESLKSFSTAAPKTLFKLHGDGENSGDIWDKYFVGGEMVREIRLKAELPVPDYDELVPDLGIRKQEFFIPVVLPVEAYTELEACAIVRDKLDTAKIKIQPLLERKIIQWDAN